MGRLPVVVDLQNLGLPAAFSTADALQAGLTRPVLERLVRDGELERLGRGVFLRSNCTDGVDADLVEIAVRAPTATICLTSALALHGLTDEIPAALDIAVPRDHWLPTVAARVAWHQFAGDTFMIGRQQLIVAGGPQHRQGDAVTTDAVTIGLYSAERSIVDAFRTRGTTGFDLATEVLRRWLRDPTHQPADLLALCAHWPRTLGALRNALEILL